MPYFAPFIKVWVVIDGADIDISETVANLKYKRDIEKENQVTLSIEQKYIEKLTDSILRRGQTLKFQYGFKGGTKSTVHQARIVELKYKYSRKITLDVTARDLGTVMKKSYSNKIWTDVTTSDICRQIAATYNLEFVGDDTEYVWQNYPQSQKDDYAFLMEIVEKDSSGNYYIYVDSGKLILERRGLDQPSALTFQYGDGTRIISFSVSEQEKTPSMQGGAGTTVTGFDPNNKEKVEATAGDDNEKEGVDLGKFAYEYSANGELLSRPEEIPGKIVSGVSGLVSGNNSGTGEDGVWATIIRGTDEDPTFLEQALGVKKVTNLKSEEEIVNEANYGKKSGKLKITKGTLKIQGEPGIKLNSVVTLRGLLNVHNGNYLVKSVTDDVSTGGFITEIVMNKNAGGQANKVTQIPNNDPGTVNTTVGPEIIESVEEIFVFDANGNRLSNPKTDYTVK